MRALRIAVPCRAPRPAPAFVLVAVLLWPGGASKAVRAAGASQAAPSSQASEASQTAPIVLAEGAARRVTVQPGASVVFTLAPAASFLDAAVTFEGAEVMATLRRGDVTLMTARIPERTRGRLPIEIDLSLAAGAAAGPADGAAVRPPAGAATGAAADAASPGASGSASRAADTSVRPARPLTPPLTLTVEVTRDFARSAQVDVQWRSRPSSPTDRERAALRGEVYAAVGEWWDGSRETRAAAAARLAACLDRIRALQSPPLLYDALMVIASARIDLSEREPAIAAATEAASVARSRGEAGDEAAALLKAAIIRGMTGETAPSIELTTQLLTTLRGQAEGKGDPRWQVEALINLAGAQMSRGAPAEALKALEEAVPLAERIGDVRQQGAAINVRGVVYGGTGRPREAAEAYERALALRRQCGDRLGLGQTLSNLGVLARDAGEPRRAVALYEEALALRRAAGFPQGVANTLYNFSNARLDLAQFQQAIDLLTESLAIWRETKGVRGEAFTLQNLGQTAARLGDSVKAAVYYEQAVALWRQVGDRRGEAIVLGYLAGNALVRGDHRAAADYVDRALASARAASARREEADTLIVSGRLQRPGDLAASEARLREAIAIHDQIKNRMGGANARTELGRTLEAAGRIDEARAAIDAALAARREIGDRRGEAIALAGLARLDRRAGALAEAQTKALHALDLMEQLRAGVLSARARLTLGVSSQDLYVLARDILIDRHLQSPHDGYDRAALAVQERARARSLLEALAFGAAPVPAGADDAADRALVARQRDLEADLEAKTARFGRLVDGGQPAEALTAARAELSALVVTLDEVKAEIRKRNPAYAALTQLAAPAALSPEAWRDLLGPDTVLIEIALGDARSIGWLVTAEGLRTVMLPPRKEIDAAARALMTALTARNLFPDGEDRKTRQARITHAERDWPREAARLTALVLAPFGDVQARRIAFVTDGALAGVPFAVLPITAHRGRLDFARACGASPVSQASPASSASSGSPSASSARASCALGQHAEVIALPSASTLAELRQRPSGTPATARAIEAPAETIASTNGPSTRSSEAKPPVRALVLADPVFRADDPRAVQAREAAVRVPSRVIAPAPTHDGGGRGAEGEVRDAAPQSLGTLPRLPFSREEARAIEAVAGRDRVVLALDFEAARAKLTSPDVRAPEVLHIATHALIDETQPELSGIVLSLIDATGQPMRGFLPLVEVYDLQVRARLVVLSACRTAEGPDVPGEGLASLTRGFMYAGSPRVVASLWSVEDRATAEFMRAFYDALFVAGQPAPAALRSAQAAMRRSPRWSSPYYWAAFTFHGDWR